MKVFSLAFIVFLLSVICYSQYLQYPKYSILNNNSLPTNHKVYYSEYYIILTNSTDFFIYETNYQILKFTIPVINFISNTEQIIDCEITNYKQLFILVQSTISSSARILLITLDQNTVQSFFQPYFNLPVSKYSDIQIVPLQIIVADQVNSKIKKIDKITKSITLTISTNPKLNRKIQTCNMANSRFFMVSWVSYCQVQLFWCYATTACISKFHQNSICSNSQYLLNFDIAFSSDCTFLSYTSKYTNYSRFYNTISNTFITRPNGSLLIIFQDIKFINTPNIFYSYKSNTSQISVYSNNISKIPLQPLFKINFQNDFHKSKYNLENGTIFTFNTNGFQLYKAYCSNVSLKYYLGQCIVCPVEFCSQCNSSGSCIKCQNGYSLISKVKCYKANTQIFNSSSEIPYIKFEIINSLSLKDIRKIPAINMILYKLFPILIDFQNLWLYSYHQKNYGAYIESLFKIIRQLESQKRIIIKRSFLQTDQFLNISSIQSQIDFKYQYSSTKYYYEEGIGNSFVTNTLDFFIVNIPIILLYLLIGKQLSLKFKWQLFKVFKFHIYFFIMILEGNYQTFSYFFAADLKSFFYFSLSVKIMNCAILFLCFLFIFVICLLYLIMKIQYGRKSQILFDICGDNLKGCIFLLIHKGLKNLALGIFHIIIDDQGFAKLIALSLIQKIYIIFLIVNIYSNKKLFSKKLLIWSYLFISYEQILLNFTFILQQTIPTQQKQILDIVQISILIFKNYRIIIYYVVSLFVFIITLMKNTSIYNGEFKNQQLNFLNLFIKNNTQNQLNIQKNKIQLNKIINQLD